MKRVTFLALLCAIIFLLQSTVSFSQDHDPTGIWTAPLKSDTLLMLEIQRIDNLYKGTVSKISLEDTKSHTVQNIVLRESKENTFQEGENEKQSIVLEIMGPHKVRMYFGTTQYTLQRYTTEDRKTYQGVWIAEETIGQKHFGFEIRWRDNYQQIYWNNPVGNETFDLPANLQVEVSVLTQRCWINPETGEPEEVTWLVEARNFKVQWLKISREEEANAKIIYHNQNGEETELVTRFKKQKK